jgi:hypothetical protein
MKFRLRHPPIPRLSENDVERACIDLLNARNWWVARLHSGTFKSIDGRRFVRGHAKGTPDYACLHHDYPGFLLEVKRPGETPSPDQERKHHELRLGFQLTIATVDNVEALNRWLDNYQTNMGRL